MLVLGRFWYVLARVRAGGRGAQMEARIICVGNEYQLDDGFGPAVAQVLRERYEMCVGAEVLDCAVMGYDIVPLLTDARSVLVVDALDATGKAPGTCMMFDPEDMAASPGLCSLHEVRVSDVVSAARFMGARARVRCVGVQVLRPAAAGLERGMSAPVAANVVPVARICARWLARVGVPPRRDRWAEARDARCRLDSPVSYVREALLSLGAPTSDVGKVLVSLGHDAMDFEADARISAYARERGLDADRPGVGA